MADYFEYEKGYVGGYQSAIMGKPMPDPRNPDKGYRAGWDDFRQGKEPRYCLKTYRKCTSSWCDCVTVFRRNHWKNRGTISYSRLSADEFGEQDFTTMGGYWDGWREGFRVAVQVLKEQGLDGLQKVCKFNNIEWEN